MKLPVFKAVSFAVVVAAFVTGCIPTKSPQIVNSPSASGIDSTWQEEFNILSCDLATTGQNDYFILEPGFQIVLEGRNEKVIITVLDETVEVDGVEARVVEEREWKNEELIEISRNFYAICEDTKDVFYFGEDVDMYKDGKITSHSGEWRAGEEDAKAGLVMPGNPAIGMKYYQEIAPGVAMDRAEVLTLDAILQTPAGSFEKLLRTQEGTALNPLEREFKTYAPGIGLIQDASVLLMDYGFIDQR